MEKHKILVLGVDGLDPSLTNRFRQQGIMPNFDKLIARGSAAKICACWAVSLQSHRQCGLLWLLVRHPPLMVLPVSGDNPKQIWLQ